METNFWDKISDLRDSISSGVEQQPEVRLPTATVKIMLGATLVQSIGVALWWSIDNHMFYPWLLPITTFLGIGWFWNKVTDSWKEPQPAVYSRLYEDSDEDSYVPSSTININNTGITGKLSDNDVDHPLRNSDDDLFV